MKVSYPLENSPDGVQGLLVKIISMVIGDATQASWAVDKPQWQPIATNNVPAAILSLVR